MRQIGMFGPDHLHEMQRLFQVEMGIVFLVMQCVDHQNVQILKMGKFRIRHKARVRNIRERPDTIA